LAVSRLKLSSAAAMKIAEKLYVEGYISYPRTETNSYSNKTNFKGILEKLKNNNLYQKYLDKNEFEMPRGGNKNDEAHPPIHPVKLF